MGSARSGRPLDEGDPKEDPKAFRSCLGQFGTGVAVVTTAAADGSLAAMTINSFSSLSLDPPLVLWSIRSQSRAYSNFAGASRFAINILRSDQIDAAHHFAKGDRDRARDGDFRVPGTEPPLLRDAVAQLECTLEASHAGGDHTILVGRVGRFARYPGRPLLFVQGQYGVHEPHPDFVAGSAPQSSAGARDGTADLVAEIFEARNRLSRRFERHRREEGIGLAQARVLRRVHETPGIDRAGLIAATFLGELELDTAVDELVDRGWLGRDAAGRHALTEEGLRRRLAVRKRWADFREAQTHGIAEADLAVARAVLARLIERE